MTAAELGETDDPRAVIPGDPAAIAGNVTAIRGRGRTLEQVATGLRTIDTGDAWTGSSADAFRDVLTAQPARWYAAADACTTAAAALESYAATLAWAQARAVDAIAIWKAADPDPPGDADRTHARDLLADARRELADAGDTAARRIAAASAAPTEPSVWTNIANWRHQLATGVQESAQAAIDLGNRFNPTRILTDPAGLATDLAGTTLNLENQRTHPTRAIEQTLDLDTWKTSPPRALGHLIPDLAAGVIGGGGFIGKRLGVEAAEEAATTEAATARATADAAYSGTSVQSKLTTIF